MARLSANLNQVVRLVHAGRAGAVPEELSQRVLEAVQPLRLARLGHGGGADE